MDHPKPLDLANIIRDAFLSGRGLKPGDKLTDEDQAAWVEYDPSIVPGYQRVEDAVLAAWRNRK